MDVVAKELVDADFHEQHQRRHSLEEQRIAATFVSVTYQLAELRIILLVNLQHWTLNSCVYRLPYIVKRKSLEIRMRL